MLCHVLAASDLAALARPGSHRARRDGFVRAPDVNDRIETWSDGMNADEANRICDRRELATPARPPAQSGRSGASRARRTRLAPAGWATHRSRVSGRDGMPIAEACASCHFEPPARAHAAEELRSLAAVWANALHTTNAAAHVSAARLRDELHAVANRIARLAETPGAPISPISGQARRPEALVTQPGVGAARIELAVDRLADLVEALSPEQWEAKGTFGRSSITIGELVARPLHTSHRYFARRGAT